MAIAIVEELGEEGYAVYGPESGWSNFIEKLEDGKLLFFPFSDSYIEEPVKCADGKKHPSKFIEDKKDNYEIPIGESDCIGFSFLLKENNFIIQSSIHYGGYMYPHSPPHVKLHDCGIFKSPMQKFINTFIKK